MGLFGNKKNRAVKEIYGGVWGCLVTEHKIDVDTLSKQIRCIDKQGKLDSGQPVTFVRIFRIKDVESKGVEIQGWETLDQHPDLVLYEGYLTMANHAHIEARKATPDSANIPQQASGR